MKWQRINFDPMILTCVATVVCSASSAVSAQENITTAGANQVADPSNAPLHGLSAGASLGVLPGLDKSLLVTPGLHPAQVSAPISQVLAQVNAKIDAPALPRGKYPGWQISITNNTDRPILIEGDAASLSGGSSATGTCISMERLAQLSVLPEQSTSFKKRLSTDVKATTTAALTLGWVQTLHDQKMGSGPIVAPNGGRYGLDEQRREDQLRRFGKRVLWPGDSSSGVIYFEPAVPSSHSAPTSDQNISIDVPVASYYDKADQGLLKLRL